MIPEMEPRDFQKAMHTHGRGTFPSPQSVLLAILATVPCRLPGPQAVGTDSLLRAAAVTTEQA